MVKPTAGRVVIDRHDVAGEKGKLSVVVSMLHLSEGVQYRLVGARPEGFGEAKSAAPGLEDGYVRLMQSAGAVASASD